MVVDHTFCPTWSTPMPHMGFPPQSCPCSGIWPTGHRLKNRSGLAVESANRPLTSCPFPTPHSVLSGFAAQCVFGHATEKAVSEQGDRNRIHCDAQRKVLHHDTRTMAGSSEL